MNRREFIALLGSGVAGWPLAARAQQPAGVRRIGVLMNLTSDDPEAPGRVAAFAQGLGELGWAVGRNVMMDYRWGAGDVERNRRILLCNWHWCRRRGWPLVVRCPNRYRLALERVCGVPAGLAPDARSGTCRFALGGRRRMQAAGGSGKAARLYRIETFGIDPPVTRPKRHRMLAAAHIVLCDRDPETTAARSDADHEPSQLASR